MFTEALILKTEKKFVESQKKKIMQLLSHHMGLSLQESILKIFITLYLHHQINQRYRNLQSIGRVLRKGDNKIKATLFDIADDITYGSSKNYTLNHMMERVKIYNEENFNYEMLTIPLKKCQINF